MLDFGELKFGLNFDPATVMRGQGIYAQGQVIDADVNASGTVIVGRVRGSAAKPYRQMIMVRQTGAAATINGTCSCPVQINCKHVVAVILEAASQLRRRLAASVPAMTTAPQPVTSPRSELSPALKLWLGEVGEAIGQDAVGNDYPAGMKQRLIYVLDVAVAQGSAGQRPRVQTMVATLNRDGSFGGAAKSYVPSNINNYQPAKHLRPIDHEILVEMDFVMRRMGKGGASELPLAEHPRIAPLLAKMLSTGRCCLGSVQGPVLRTGSSRAARLVWTREDGHLASQRLTFEPVRDAEGEVQAFCAILPTSPPYYVESGTGLVGPIELGIPPALAARLVNAPAVSSLEAAHVAALLDKNLAMSSAKSIRQLVPLPEAPHKTEMREVKPVPRLELYVGEVRLKHHYTWYDRTQRHRDVFELPLARLAFDYAGVVVPFDATAEVVEHYQDDLLVLTPRDGRAELDAHNRLGKLGLKLLKDSPLDAVGDNGKPLFFAPNESRDPYAFLEKFDDPSLFLAFSAEAMPKLVAEGWQIKYSEDYPYRIAEGEVGWWADVGEGSGIDWFSFELGIDFEGQRINLAPQIASLLASLPGGVLELIRSDAPVDADQLITQFGKMQFYFPLPDGRQLPLPGGRLIPVFKALVELIGPRADALENGKVRLHRAEAGALAAAAAALGAGVAWAAGADRLIALGQDLQRGRALKDVAPPAGFKTELRPYQAQGLSWLDFLRETGFGGVLADDMGLGKTVQALAFLLREKVEGRLDKPALIVAPTSVVPNWQAEAERFAPALKVLALRGLDRKRMFGDIAGHDLVLTTYPLLARDHQVLLAHEFYAVILDEAQAIKNPKASISQLTHAIKARHRLALTGTPLENNLGEVWSLFQFLSPGLLGDETTFRRTFRTPIEKHGCPMAQSFLTRRLKPFMLRRTKQEVAKELPPKTEIIERVRLEGAQRDLYETVRVLMHDKVRDEIAKKGLAKSHIIFLDALLKLRQICCDPRLLKLPQARKVKQSAKLERLMEILPEMVVEGRRILLFSQFTSMLALIEAELTSRNIPYVMLTGDTKDRVTPVKAFQSGNAPVFLLSLKAGGTGLNLTAADTVIHYDPWWNPAVEAQATDRAHRIGQLKPVFVYKLMVEEGIEEAIELLKARKAALAEALFAGSSKSGLDLTEADISALFAPLSHEPRRKAA